MAEGNGNGTNGTVRLPIAALRFFAELVGLLFAGFLLWSNLKSDLRDESTRNEMHRAQLLRDIARLEKQISLADAWARDLDVRLAGAGVTVPRQHRAAIEVKEE
jgi:hypothetical protein